MTTMVFKIYSINGSVKHTLKVDVIKKIYIKIYKNISHD